MWPQAGSILGVDLTFSLEAINHSFIRFLVYAGFGEPPRLCPTGPRLMRSGEGELMWTLSSGLSVDIRVKGPFYREKNVPIPVGRLVAQIHRAEWPAAQEKAVQLMKVGQVAIWRIKSGFMQEVMARAGEAEAA